jgi:hypothetical protein
VAFAALLASALGALHTVAGTTSVVDALRLDTPAAAVLGDEQFDQATAGRPAPPMFVDTSVTRLIGSSVTANQLESALSGDPTVCAVLFATGRLASVAGFQPWVAARYPARVDLGAGRTLYVRPRCHG